ncbi:MAG: nuclear transport factor 2 family protein [Anaerolineae bacterium]|nr:nuclear transport factor 2 family protein [Anaerolineae bacterium]
MSDYGMLQSDAAAEADVLAVVERFRRGWEHLSAEEVLGTVARKDDMVMYGTDLAERWVGFDTMVEPTQAMVAVFEHPVYTWGAGEPLVWVRGDAGWVCGDLKIDYGLGGKPFTTIMRSTFVVAREDGEWKIAHAHFSVGQVEPVADYGAS